MKATNWQTKALTPFIAALALWFATACTEPGSEFELGIEYLGSQRITPSAPCGPDVPLSPSIELAQLNGTSSQEKSMALRAREKRLRPEEERIQAILDEHRDRLERSILRHREAYGFFFEPDLKPHLRVGHIWTENMELTDKIVIEIKVYQLVDQSTLPSEDRIHECLDGVEVHFEKIMLINIR